MGDFCGECEYWPGGNQAQCPKIGWYRGEELSACSEFEKKKRTCGKCGLRWTIGNGNRGIICLMHPSINMIGGQYMPRSRDDDACVNFKGEAV